MNTQHKSIIPKEKLTKRADGRYACKYEDRFFYGKTATEALKKRNEYVESLQQGYNANLMDAKFEDYARDWLDAYRSSCNSSQKKQYESFVDYTVKHLRPVLVRDITAMDIQKLFNTLQGYSNSHITKFTSMIRSIFKAAIQDGIILRSPAEMAKAPKGTCGSHRALEGWEKELVQDTCQDHEFGLCAMTMMYAGLRRGEVLYLDIDRDVDFKKKTITVRGAVSFVETVQGTVSDGKTEFAQRVIPLLDPLAEALEGHHGLLCTREDGTLMSLSSFDSKYDSYIKFLETKVNGCHKRWYGKMKEHKALLAAGGEMPEWQEVIIRCHDFRVTFCTTCYNAGVPIKTLQAWMGHSDAQMIMKIYAKLTAEKEKEDALKLNEFVSGSFVRGKLTTDSVVKNDETHD